MSIEVKLTGEGPGVVKVEDEAILTSVLPYPPINVPNKLIPFLGNLTINGDGVTSELTVDGSVIPVDAFVGPPTTGDLYLTIANILIADSGVIALNRFGGITGGLTNGIDFFIETESARISIAKGLKTNFDFIRLSTLTQGLGSKNDAYQMSNANAANEDAYNPILDLKNISPLGIRLRKDTLDKFGLTINDDLSAIGTFNILMQGYVRI